MVIIILKIIKFIEKIIEILSFPYCVFIIFIMAFIAVFNLMRSGSMKTNELGQVYSDNKKDIKLLIYEYINVFNIKIRSNKLYLILWWILYLSIICAFWFFSICYISSLLISFYE